ncbi:hypothetical protein [Streptomyces sp. CFMR 7]|uniref:hypothetical protein n=1 Tax=Streptomyces sp. CFMR 7 TaxID=1649184 RepID=UPI0006AD3E7B|nr:hypothetical protein [Streptomyces sp. CFMR 7]ALC29186.1 hypothetical protein ABE83_20505 [Streptomyces sp. CFMR 7]
MPFEDELSEQLRRTGTTFDLTARTAVVDGALARGQRSLRRRRGAAVAGSVLALALVGGGGAFGAGLLGGGPGGGTDVAGGGSVAATLTSAPDGASPAAGTPEPDAEGTPSARPDATPTQPDPAPTRPTATPTAQGTPPTGQVTPPAGERSEEPPSGGPVGSPAPPLDYALLMPTFLKLLPQGVTVGEKVDSGGEFASVVVDDGQGRSLVQINVQRDMRDVADQLYGDVTTLPDGTLLATSQVPGEKGGKGVVWWTADTMRPDGMRVVVSAFNSGAQSTPATRPEPALTMKQLTALATSPEWLKLQQK